MQRNNFIFIIILLFCSSVAISQVDYNYPSSSVLSKGNWYKLEVSETGIHKLIYNDFVKMGIDMSNVKSSDISLFGNGGNMLPEDNRVSRYNDLMENPIYVEDGGDGKFGAGDYILFYGESANTWVLRTPKIFDYKVNTYENQAYYFLTVDPSIGSKKRITTAPQITEAETDVITTFNGRAIHKRELYNVCMSGKTFLGEKFNNVIPTHPILPFSFPNAVTDSNAVIAFVLASQSTSSEFTIKINNKLLPPIFVGAYSYEIEDYTAVRHEEILPASSLYNINITFSNMTELGEGFLDRITINILQNLVLNGEQMNFRSIESVGKGKRSLFKIRNANSKTVVWDVTNSIEPIRMNTSLVADEVSFVTATDTLKEFVIFNGNASLTPTFIEKVPNQDLHAIPQVDYVIVTHPTFKPQAERLAKIHRTNNGLEVAVVTTNEVYNEFSSGKQDPIAIRCFMKMLYDRGDSEAKKKPRYLLLFGSGTYDPKNVEKKAKRNFVVVYQKSTLDRYNVYEELSNATDDIFGLLDNINKLNIGIGRFPASTIEQATNLVDKVENYMSRKDISTEGLKGNWRNIVTLISDDPDSDGSLYSIHSENLAEKLGQFPSICIEKIYSDAYKQISSALGTFYPEVTQTINNRVNNGCLLLNYIGHGSYMYLGHERYITSTDIVSWKNKYALPVFIANTCSFSRYDLTEKASAGEDIVLNPNGGCIATIAPSRDVSVNVDLNNSFFINALTLINGEPPAFGDITRLAKNENDRVLSEYLLIGDPALKISLPKNKIRTTKVNNKAVNAEADTFQALSNVYIEGEITDGFDNVLSDFNGTIYPTIYDKPTKVATLGNEGEATIRTFLQQKSIIYKGKAIVKDGKFSFSCIVPRDISYNFDKGKVSYYAQNGANDAVGLYSNIVFGGIDESVDAENTPYPTVKLYMNDTHFRAGGITDQNPTLLAYIIDDYGVNMVGSGIGHDIAVVLDNKVNEEIIANDFFDIDSLGRGIIQYPLNNLAPGVHTLSLKAWNIFNKSTTSTISFVVQTSDNFELGKLKNSPNPFKEKTTISIEHNLPNSIEKAELHIFNTSGQLVYSSLLPINVGSYLIGPLEWDGKNMQGQRLGAGIYISCIIVTTKSGNVKTENQKLVILP